MDEWRWMTAVELGQQIRAGQIDPVALTETYLAAIESHRLTPRMMEFTATGLMMKRSACASLATPKAPQRKARGEREAGKRRREPTAARRQADSTTCKDTEHDIKP